MNTLEKILLGILIVGLVAAASAVLVPLINDKLDELQNGASAAITIIGTLT